MDEETRRRLAKDPDGLLTYEFIANHIGVADDIMDELVDNMISVDHTGQFTVSAARYLSAVGSKDYAKQITRLVAAAIEKDREHRYIGDLLASIWGNDYKDHIDTLIETDNNFRRIYKRLYPANPI